VNNNGEREEKIAGVGESGGVAEVEIKWAKWREESF